MSSTFVISSLQLITKKKKMIKLLFISFSNVINIKFVHNTSYILIIYAHTGQFMSCTDRSRNDYVNNDVYFERNYILTKMVNELYSQFYSNNLTDMKTSKTNHISY